LPRSLDGGEMKFFLGAEMSKEAALAHRELISQATDRDSLESLE